MGAQYNKGFRVRLNNKPYFSSACLPTINITHKSTLDPQILGRCDTDPLGPRVLINYLDFFTFKIMVE